MLVQSCGDVGGDMGIITVLGEKMYWRVGA